MVGIRKFDVDLGRWEHESEERKIQIVTANGEFEISENNYGNLQIRSTENSLRVFPEFANQITIMVNPHVEKYCDTPEPEEEIEHFGSMGRHVFGG